MKPSQEQIQAYLDDELAAAERAVVEDYLARHPEVAEQLARYRRDGEALRQGFSQVPLAANPALHPFAARRAIKARRRRRFATAATLVLALGCGWFGGSQWQSRLYAKAMLPMSDAVEAYRLFSQAPAKGVDQAQLAGWFDSHFKGASLPPALDNYGLKRVGAELMATAEGPAAMVLYRNDKGQALLFFIRPPGPRHHMLPKGERQDGSLLARYWSDKDFNYALVSPHDSPLVPRGPFGSI